MSTAAGGTAPLVAEALRAGEGAVRPDLLQALRGAAGAVLPMDAVQEAPQPEPPAHQAAQQTVVRAFGAGFMLARNAITLQVVINTCTLASTKDADPENSS